MKIRRIIFLINSLWELVRFLALYLAAVLVARQAAAGNYPLLRWLLVLASPGLLLPVGFLFLYLDPLRHLALLGPLCLAKGLALVASVLLLLAAPFELFGAGPGLVPAEGIPLLILAGAVFVDLAFLLVVLPTRRRLH